VERAKILRQFGQRVTELREEKGITIEGLAAAADLDYLQVVEIEEGKINVLFTTIVALAEALGINPEDLLDTL
jgi:transcriptional regulator with XRE-family HTH domain